MRCPVVEFSDKSARLICAFVCLWSLGEFASAEEPLHVRIDRLVQVAQSGVSAGECTDAEFLRRVSLDLNGIIPSAAEARAYLKDTATDKRTALVDRMLSHPRYARHLAATLDVMFMERLRATHVKAPQWLQYLHESVAANKPYDQLVLEILSADGTEQKNRAASRFYLDREGEPHALARDVGRIFFGRDMQCAQCHDHPLIDDYLQEDYYGIFAFVNRTSLFTDTKAKKSFLAEKAQGDAVFTSVFTEQKGRTLPRLPGEVEIEEPVIPAAEAYKVKPAKKVRSVPKYSRREAMAQRVNSGANRAFNRNIANRLWAHMMGRGLVHPLDLHHPGNPPSHPELLDLLADEIVAMKYDMKSFLRELALTQTYRRSFDIPRELSGTVESVSTKLEPLTIEQTRQAAIVAELETQTDTALDQVHAVQETVFQAEAAHQNAKNAYASAKKQSDDAAKALADSQKQLSTKQQAVQVLADALAKADEVVKQFPEDEALISAAKTYRERTKQTADEIAALHTTIETQAAAAKSAAEKLSEQRRQLETVAKTLSEATQRLSALRGPYFKKLYAYRAAQTTLKHIELRLNNVNALKSYLTATQERKAAEQAVVVARNGLNEIQTATAQAEAELNAAQANVEAPRHSQGVAARQADTIRAKFLVEQTLFQQVSDAAHASEIALAALPQDADLQSSTGQLTALAVQLKTQLAPLQEQLQTADTAAMQAAEALSTAQQKLAAAEEELRQAEQFTAEAESRFKQADAAEKTRQAMLDEASQRLSEQFITRFVTGALKPLTPEQLSWSIMQATGVVSQQETAAVAEVDKKEKLSPISRPIELEAAVYEKLKGNVATFVKTFGAGAGQPQQEFFGTVDQALFVTNGTMIRGWLNPSGDNLTGRLQKIQDPAACAEELYLTIFTRYPTPQEVDDVSDYLASQSESERAAAVRELAWAMLASAEFRFGH